MKKKLALILAVVLCLLLLCGCASRDIKKAKTAYASGDYQTVVELIEGLKKPTDEAMELLRNAKVHIAFDAGDYQQVLDLIGDSVVNDPEIDDIFQQAKAALETAGLEEKKEEIREAMEVGDYEKAVEIAEGDEAAAADEEVAAMVEQAKAAIQRIEEESAALAAAAEALEARRIEIQAAIDAGDYEKAIELADSDKTVAEDSEVAEMVSEAKDALAKLEEEAAAALEEKKTAIKAAIDAGDYEKAIELVGGDEAAAEDSEVAELLSQAEAGLTKVEEDAAASAAAAKALEEKKSEIQAALDAEDYQKAIEIAEEAAADEEIAEMVSEAKAALERMAEETAEAEELAAAKLEIRAALDAGDFEKAADLAADADTGDKEVAAMLTEAVAGIAVAEKKAEITAAFEAGDYEEVAKLAVDADAADAEIAAMVAEANTAIAAAEKKAEIIAAYEAGDYAKVTELAADPSADTADVEIAEMLKDASVQLAYMAGDYQKVAELLADDEDRASNELYYASKREIAKQMIAATEDVAYVQLPQDFSYLTEFKTMYIDRLEYDPTLPYSNKSTCGPSAPVEKVPALKTGRLPMPFVYEGTEVTVLAEEGSMSFIIYRDIGYLQYAGWTQTKFLVDEFPGDYAEIGTANSAAGSLVEEADQRQSKKGFLDTVHNYDELVIPVENCVGFTLDYQLVEANTPWMRDILGPRTVYVFDGENWIKAGSFDYPHFGTYRVTVNLKEPTDIYGVGIIPNVYEPYKFWDRLYLSDFMIAE